MDNITREQQGERCDEVVHILAVAHHERRQPEVEPHEKKPKENAENGGRGQKLFEHTVVAAADYGADEEFAAQGAALSTLASFVVIPVLMLML